MAALLLLMACVPVLAAQEPGTGSSPAGRAQATASRAQSRPHAEPPGPPGGESRANDSRVLFKAEAKEVVLQATVVDAHHRPVVSLGKEDFHVFEDGKPQKITGFRREDVPVALALLIDDSGSMRAKRADVNAAALDLVRASNPHDEVCVVNFAEHAYLDQDFTGNVQLLSKALRHIDARGGTALYDTLIASVRHLQAKARLQRRVILVVTDGEDTASRDSLEQALRVVSVEGGPSVYAIGLMGGKKHKMARRALRVLAEQTGGVSYFPSSLKDVDSTAKVIARELRNQYMIAYSPSDAGAAGQYRRVLVRASAPGYKGLVVRTRSGYYISGPGSDSLGEEPVRGR